MEKLKRESTALAISDVLQVGHNAGIIVFQYRQSGGKGHFTAALNQYVGVVKENKPLTSYARVKFAHLEPGQEYPTTVLRAYEMGDDTYISIRLYQSNTEVDFNHSMDFLRDALKDRIEITGKEEKKIFSKKLRIPNYKRSS